MLDDSQVRTYGEMLGVGVEFLTLGDHEGVFFVVGGLGLGFGRLDTTWVYSSLLGV